MPQTMKRSQLLVDKLVQARKDKHLTQQDVADRMGVHVRFVQRIEANVGDRQIGVFFRYAEAVGASIDFEVAFNETELVNGL